MPQMVIKLSDENVIREVRHEAKIADRSIPGQIEHWVKLGQAVEALLPTADVNAIKENLRIIVGRPTAESATAKVIASINRLLTSTDRTAIKAGILEGGIPVYQSDPENPGRVVRIMPDGTRTSGTIKGGEFVQAAARRGR